MLPLQATASLDANRALSEIRGLETVMQAACRSAVLYTWKILFCSACVGILFREKVYLTLQLIVILIHIRECFKMNNRNIFEVIEAKTLVFLSPSCNI